MEQRKQTNKTDADTEIRLTVGREDSVKGLGEKDDGSKKYRLVVTEQSQGGKA